MMIQMCAIYNTIMNTYYSISGELKSNVSVLWDMIDIRDGVEEWDSLCMDGEPFTIDDICIN